MPVEFREEEEETKTCMFIGINPETKKRNVMCGRPIMLFNENDVKEAFCPEHLAMIKEWYANRKRK